MKSSKLINRLLVLFLLNFIVTGLYSQGQTQGKAFVPQVGQDGKDVIWVPTPEELVKKMLEIAWVAPTDFVVDLGSGDGRTVIAAAKLGARAVGIEFNPDMVELSRKNAREAGVEGKATFLNADLFEYDLSDATVITMFLLPDINLKLRPKLLKLRPGTRIVSNTFTMGEWEPDIEATTEDNWNSWNTALMWVVPARVEGTWQLAGGELGLQQEFQMIYGTYKHDGKTSSISDGRLNGAEITFRIDGEVYTGKVNGNNTMLGTATLNSRKSDWSATRKSD